jgi:hypothetical protein
MIDVREQILERLPVVCAGVTGIGAVARNRLDVPGLTRPAVLIMDGVEETSLDRPAGGIKRFSQIQFMELTPEIRILLRADDGTDAGAVTSLFRRRVISSILNDAALQAIMGANGIIRYGGCSVPEPDPQTKEPRLDLTFVFTYPLRLSDLT